MISMTWPQYQRREATIDGRVVKLFTRQVADLVSALLLRDPTGFVPIGQLIEATWPNPDFEPEFAVNHINVLIGHARRDGVPIENDCGFGWRIPAWARGREPMKLAA